MNRVVPSSPVKKILLVLLHSNYELEVLRIQGFPGVSNGMYRILTKVFFTLSPIVQSDSFRVCQSSNLKRGSRRFGLYVGGG